jgi:hypothetical protein
MRLFWKITNFASRTLGIAIVPVLPIKEVSVEGQGLTAEKYLIKMRLGIRQEKCFMQLTFVLP